MACTQGDFEEGGVIYVRGQKAICKRTDDYPLIFWAYDDNPSVLYHRSLKDDADMFSIHPPENDSKIESKDESLDTIPQSVSPDAGLSEASGSQPPKTTYENLEDDIIACDVVAPGAVHIEKCSQTTFTLDSQVSSITLVECKDVTVNFLSVISMCEAIRSVDCKILCKDKCTTFKMDECKKIQITFPKRDDGESDNDDVKVVTTNCSEITLVAKADPQSHDEDISYKVRRTSVSISDKYQTSFNGKFETEEWADVVSRTSPSDSKEENKASEEEKKNTVVEKGEEKSEEKSEEKNTEVSVEGAGSAAGGGSADASGDPGGGTSEAQAESGGASSDTLKTVVAD